MAAERPPCIKTKESHSIPAAAVRSRPHKLICRYMQMQSRHAAAQAYGYTDTQQQCAAELFHGCVHHGCRLCGQAFAVCARAAAGRIHAVGWEDAERLSLCGSDAPAAIELTEERAMYELLTGFNDIYDAYRRTARGKHKKNEVVRYETNLHMQLWYLKERLEKRAYRISGYHKFMIYDPKEREIQALSFSDRVFQHLLCDMILRQYFEPRLIYDNAACRVGKGTHFAMGRLEHFLREHYKHHGSQGYILKYDIRKYFDSIDHEVLKKKLAKFPDEEVKTLLYHIIDSYEHTPGRGIPMGNQSSQWFALYYLDRLDRLIKEKLRIKYYVRYMDDGIIVHHDKKFLQQALKEMTELVHEDGLEFNAKTQIFPISQGADFLGFRFYLTDSGKVIKRLRTSNKRRFKRRLKLFQKLYNKNLMSAEEIVRSLVSYDGHLQHGHTWRLRHHIYETTVFTHAQKELQSEAAAPEGECPDAAQFVAAEEEKAAQTAKADEDKGRC